MAIYSGEIQATGCTLDVYLNAYHLYSSKGASHHYSTNLRAWLEASNEFRAVAGVPADTSNKAPVRFSVLANAVDGNTQRPLVRMKYPAGIAVPPAPPVPFDTRGQTLVAGNNLRFAVEEAGIVVDKPWNATDQRIGSFREIYNEYLDIQKAFVAADIEKIMGLSRSRITFSARLYDKRRTLYEQEVREDLQKLFATPPVWKPINDEKELTVHEFLPGKVVRVLDLQENPPLRTVADADGMQTGYDVILSMTAEGLVWTM